MILYITGTNSQGQFLLGGIFKLKDELGIALETSFALCEKKEILIDWMEYLADAGRQKDWKFDSAVDDMRFTLGIEAREVEKKFNRLGGYYFEKGLNFQEVCERIYNDKRNARNQTKN